MIIEHNNQKYKLYWRYIRYVTGTYKAVYKKKEKIRIRYYLQLKEKIVKIITTCILEDLETNHKIVWAIATPHPKDKFIKKVGRELSFKRLLERSWLSRGHRTPR